MWDRDAVPLADLWRQHRTAQHALRDRLLQERRLGRSWADIGAEVGAAMSTHEWTRYAARFLGLAPGEHQRRRTPGAQP